MWSPEKRGQARVHEGIYPDGRRSILSGFETRIPPRTRPTGPGQTHATLDQPPKLDHVGRQHGALVTPDDARVVLDEEQAVGVDHDVELVLARESERDPRRELHVLGTAEAGVW